MIFLHLFLTFLKIGAFTFGGGYAMLPLIEEAVIVNGWLTEEQVLNFIAVSESTPGPFAINSATYVGMQTASAEYGTLGGIFGSFCATLGVVLPSFVIILIVAHCYEKFKNSSIVNGCMTGLKPAVIGLISAAIVTTGKTVFFPLGINMASIKTMSFVASVIIFAVMLVLALKKKHPILIIVLSAILGIVAGYIGENIKIF